MNGSEGHVPPALFHLLIESVETGDRVREIKNAEDHLGKCAACRQRFGDYRAAQRTLDGLSVNAVEDMKPGADCRPQEEWNLLAAGLPADEIAERYVDHAAYCTRCGPLLREAMADLAAEPDSEEARTLSVLPSSRPEAQKRLAAALASGGRARQKQTAKARWVWLVAAAAVAAAAVVFATLRGAFRTGPENAQKLLAEAYSADRQIELRIPGARYAPLKTERGASGGSERLPLLRAEVLIDKKLNEQPSNAAWLALDGRAELLEGKFQQAQSTLERALRLDPNSPDILTDLATADYERAQQEDRDDEYMAAAERLTDALRLAPSDAVALFNRALVYERIGSYPLAVEDWQQYLHLDSKSGWAEREAQQHLDRLKKRMNAVPQSDRVPTDPAAAAAWLASRLNQRPGGAETSSSGEEQLLDIAVTSWLPSALFAWPAAAGDKRRAEHTALDRLAAFLIQRHGDRWLRDVLAAPRSPSSGLGATALARAIRSNAAGQPDAAEKQATEAEKLFRAAGNPAAALRAELELAYAFQREANNAPRCAATARSALQELGQRRRYPWIETQLLLEAASGEGMQRNWGAAEQDTRHAMNIAKASEYDTLYLRSLGYAAGTATVVGDFRQGWQWDRIGLEQYWAGSYPPARAYQFFSDMGFAPEAAGYWPVAEALAREAVGTIAGTPNRSTEAMARFRMAKLATAAGDSATARREFERAGQIFASLPPDRAFETYQAWCQVDLADLEVETGAPDRALARLRQAASLVGEAKNGELSQRFYRGLGEAYLAEGSVSNAEQALLRAVSLAERGLKSLGSGAERVAWSEATADVYRGLVRAELKGRDDPASAFGVWEWYRSGPVRALEGEMPELVATDSAIATLPASFQAEATKWVRDEQPALRAETLVSYAQFRDGIEIWTFDDRGIEEKWVPVGEAELEGVARRFGEECANEASSLGELRSDGRQLYQWLIAPIEPRLRRNRVLVMETDGAISRIPLAALVNPQGEYLGSRFAMTFSPGLGYERQEKRSDAFSSTARVLAIGSPALSGEWQTMFAPLPEADAEARAVAADFHSAVLLSGRSASLPAVLGALPRTEIFHFAGHALAEGKRTGLLLAAEDTSGSEEASLLDAAELNSRELRECRLAVLSACSTATGDNATPVDPGSLVGAFLLAGVPHVVASRWNVNSAATALLMNIFYRRLLAGDSVPKALQGAAETVRRNPATAHPYDWAAFSAYGEG